MENKETYINLRNSLDSFRDVALAEFALIESNDGKKEFSDFVTEQVKGLLGQIAVNQQAGWMKMNAAQAKKFEAHAQALLLANEHSPCPPGFASVDGICVRI